MSLGGSIHTLCAIPAFCPSAISRCSAVRQPLQRQKRCLSSDLIPLQTLNASRILPYRASDLYHVIADISSYKSFIPYLQSSTVTSKSRPDPWHNHQWPHTADLYVGYGPYKETFTSRVYCVPYTVLEAVAGEAEPTIPTEKLTHYFPNGQPPETPAQNADGSLFTSLLTRWSFHEFPFKPNPPDGPPQEGNANKKPSNARTEVKLYIEVKFASPVYAALSQAAAPKVAGIMVDAFEKRAREVLGEAAGETSSSEQDADRKSALL